MHIKFSQNMLDRFHIKATFTVFSLNSHTQKVENLIFLCEGRNNLGPCMYLISRCYDQPILSGRDPSHLFSTILRN